MKLSAAVGWFTGWSPSGVLRRRLYFVFFWAWLIDWFLIDLVFFLSFDPALHYHITARCALPRSSLLRILSRTTLSAAKWQGRSLHSAFLSMLLPPLFSSRLSALFHGRNISLGCGVYYFSVQHHVHFLWSFWGASTNLAIFGLFRTICFPPFSTFVQFLERFHHNGIHFLFFFVFVFFPPNMSTSSISSIFVIVEHVYVMFSLVSFAFTRMWPEGQGALGRSYWGEVMFKGARTPGHPTTCIILNDNNLCTTIQWLFLFLHSVFAPSFSPRANFC